MCGNEPRIIHHTYNIYYLLAESRAFWWLSVSTILARSYSHNFRMNGSRDAVIHLAIDLWQGISFNCTRILQITNRRSIHDISHNKSLDSLIFWHKHGRRLAANSLHVSSTVLVASSISTLLCHVYRLILRTIPAEQRVQPCH